VAIVNFYLVRHGDALSAAENPQRPLSADGRRRVQQTAGMALERGIQVSVIYHSGILRAKESAEILGERMSVATVAELSGLLPEDDPAIVKAELDAANDSILLVGHLPFMSRLAGLLVIGDPEQQVVEFSPATLVCFIRSAAQWKMAWQIAP
jgi:phosphohistidine phosphatase